MESQPQNPEYMINPENHRFVYITQSCCSSQLFLPWNFTKEL